MSKKKVYDYSGIEVLSFDSIPEDEESNLLLRAYAMIPPSPGSDGMDGGASRGD